MRVNTKRYILSYRPRWYIDMCIYGLPENQEENADKDACPSLLIFPIPLSKFQPAIAAT
jgi:hypothetical protein